MHQDSPKCKFPLKKKIKKTSTVLSKQKVSKIFHSLSNSFFYSVDKLSGSDADDKSVEAERVADDLYEGLLQEARDL